jgi:cell wall-associated protease
MNKLYIYLIMTCLFGESTFAQSGFINSKTNVFKKELTVDEQKNWQHKDIILDSIPGLSLDRAYKELIKDKKAKEIIVAIIDTEIDINHEDLKEAVWFNKKEIPNNNIDDDRNGYIDDINGWNFLGNKKGESVLYNSLESVRIVRKFKKEFQGKSQQSIAKNRQSDFLLYQKALILFENLKKEYQDDVNYISMANKSYRKTVEVVKNYFPKDDYTIKKLDSLINLKKDDKLLIRQFDNMKDVINFGISEKWLTDYQKNLDHKKETNSLEYNDRILIGDNIEDINDRNYGNNNVSKNAVFLKHGTEILGTLSSNRENNIGTKGFSNNIKIMSLAISAYGDENDKDIALAIRYAVNNGAKVINMSFGKSMSINQKWVFDAIKYAESKNVLIVAGAGNGGLETNYENPHYPNDNNFINKEVSNNYIVVGSITSKVNQNFVSNFSNYSKQNVDVFAPGSDVFLSIPENKYDFDSGTSLAAPMVSGTAALIWLYYPKLTAPQVKQIILDSGVSYDIEVIVPGSKDKKLKFSELSKSGKVVNVYNAMIMASTIRN